MNQPLSLETVRAALAYVPPDLPREDWARVGMGLKSEFPDGDGFKLFNDWSAGDKATYTERACRDTWRSITADGGVTIATVIGMAKARGFQVPASDEAQPSAAEQAKRARERALQRDAETKRRQAEHEGAAAEAASFWEGNAQPVTDPAQAPYLVRKGVKPYGVRFAPPGVLVVPVRDGAGKLWNLQSIQPTKPRDGAPEKRFLKGGRKAGLWHMLGDPAGAAVLLACEGYATGASVHEATGRPVAVAFDAGNLAAVVRELHRLYPAALLVIAADNDRETEERTGKNPGREKAEAAAHAVAGVVALPPAGPADAPPENRDFNDLHHAAGVEAVRDVIEGVIAERQAQPPAPAAPRGEPAADDARPDPFHCEASGVYFVGRDRDGDELPPLWLCGPLEVTARTRDPDGGAWGYLLRFRDPAGRPKEWAMPARALAGDGTEYRGVLLGLGLQIATSAKARNRLTEYLQTRQPEALATCTERTGWHPLASGGGAYVLPDQTIGAGDELLVFQSEGVAEKTFRQKCDAAAWRDRIGALCVGNSRLVFAVACAFAGPLLRPAGVDSGGFHLRGASSNGKTTALRVAASVCGAPNYLQRWRATDNGLEAVAAQHCDALLILDEIAQLEPRIAGETAYLLANETGKARASRGGTLRPRLTWRLLFLSAGEVGLADHMAVAQKRARVGQEVRLVDVPADAGAGMGVFENLHGRDGGAALAVELDRMTSGTYGAPGLAWLQWCAAEWQGLRRRVRERMDALRADWVPAGSSGQVERVATRFAVVAVAGELATGAGLTGWPEGEATRAARTCFEAWLAQRGDTGDAETRQMLAQVKRFFELNAEGRFSWWHRADDDRSPKTLNRAGFRRLVTEDGTPIKRSAQLGIGPNDPMPPPDPETTTTEFFVSPEVWRREVCEGFDPAMVSRVLIEAGALKPESERKYTERVRLPGVGNARVYHVLPALFDLEL